MSDGAVIGISSLSVEEKGARERLETLAEVRKGFGVLVDNFQNEISKVQGQTRLSEEGKEHRRGEVASTFMGTLETYGPILKRSKEQLARLEAAVKFERNSRGEKNPEVAELRRQGVRRELFQLDPLEIPGALEEGISAGDETLVLAILDAPPFLRKKFGLDKEQLTEARERWEEKQSPETTRLVRELSGDLDRTLQQREAIKRRISQDDARVRDAVEMLASGELNVEEARSRGLSVS